MRANEFLNEATFDVSADADWIYEKYFKAYAESIINDTWDFKIPQQVTLSSELLQSQDAKKAHEKHPINIIIHSPTTTGNEYHPLDHQIFVNLGSGAIDYIRQNDGLTNTLAHMGSALARRLKTEFTPARIKGSISHEISHWVDDTLHNQHIRNIISTARHGSSKDRLKAIYQGHPDVALTNYEINAQIHAIKELKSHNEDMWDIFDFDDVIELNASLGSIRSKLQQFGYYNKWKRMLLQRMAREGLLGKQMSQTYG